jgi:hypothetical protein
MPPAAVIGCGDVSVVHRRLIRDCYDRLHEDAPFRISPLEARGLSGWSNAAINRPLPTPQPPAPDVCQLTGITLGLLTQP